MMQHAILGAGNVGTAIARAVTTAGHEVVVADLSGPVTDGGSAGAERVQRAAPRARAFNTWKLIGPIT